VTALFSTLLTAHNSKQKKKHEKHLYAPLGIFRAKSQEQPLVIPVTLFEQLLKTRKRTQSAELTITGSVTTESKTV
jgi:hypothetical protein